MEEDVLQKHNHTLLDTRSDTAKTPHNQELGAVLVVLPIHHPAGCACQYKAHDKSKTRLTEREWAGGDVEMWNDGGRGGGQMDQGFGWTGHKRPDLHGRCTAHQGVE